MSAKETDKPQPRSNAMQSTVSFSATAKYGHGGRQYIARITGRDAKYTFAREFVGRKTGKRAEDAEFDTDEPGLYMECDVDKHGDKTETYYIVHELPDYGLSRRAVTKEVMMRLAKQIDKGESLDWTREALSDRLAALKAADLEGIVELNADQMGLTAGKMRRADIAAAIERILNPESVCPKSEAIARVKALMAELDVTLVDLS
jgi:hypothetical protein